MASNADKAQITWQGNVTFTGSAKEFAEFAEFLKKQPIRTDLVVIDKGDVVIPDDSPIGGMRDQLQALVRSVAMKQSLDKYQRIPAYRIGGIAGGIRTPHIHLGDEVVLIDKEQFKTVMGEVGRAIAVEKVEAGNDYVGIVNSVLRG